MSKSSIFVLDKNFKGTVICDFNNSHLFVPCIWDILLDKYYPDREILYYEKECPVKVSLIHGGQKVWDELQNRINKCNNFSDRLLWELSIQQVFFGKDKEKVANAINDFLKTNKKYAKSPFDDSYLFDNENIVHRFEEVRDEILQIDAPYFVFKITSCDDNVENWFLKYSEEDDDYLLNGSLKDKNDIVTYFIIIDDNIIGYCDNLSFCKERGANV